MTPRLFIVLTLLATGPAILLAGTDIDNFINRLQPDDRGAIHGKRESAYHRCRVIARACALDCVKKYREKSRQALCFKENKCAKNLEACIVNVQEKYAAETAVEDLQP